MQEIVLFKFKSIFEVFKMTAKSHTVLPKFLLNNLNTIAKCERFVDDCKIISKPLVSGSNFLSCIIAVSISGNKFDSNDNELNLIVKLLPRTEDLKDECIPDEYRFFERETFVYTAFLPEIIRMQSEYSLTKSCYFAKCFAASSQTKNEMVILENLSDRDFKMYTNSKSLDYEHVELIIKHLANYHALTYAMKLKKPSLTRHANKFTMRKENHSKKFPQIMENCKQKALAIIDCVHKKRVEDYCKDMMGKYFEIYDSDKKDEEVIFNTLCHGDLWMNNIMFKYEDGVPCDVVLLDWQFFRHASPLTDLYYLFYTSTDEDFRLKHMDEFLDKYYKTLSESLEAMGCDPGICYPEHIFRRQIKDKLALGLLIGLSIIPLVLVDKNSFNVDKSIETEVADILCNAQYNDCTINWINGIVRDMIRLAVI